jgi:hypothetical protein
LEVITLNSLIRLPSRLNDHLGRRFAIQHPEGHSYSAVVASFACYQPYRRVANPRQHFRKSVATAASLAVTHPPRKSRLLPHEKCAPQFAFGSSQRNRMTLMFGAA